MRGSHSLSGPAIYVGTAALLEMNRDSRREPHAILALTIETSVDPIELPTDGNWPGDSIIQPSADSIDERSIRVRDSVAAADMPSANQELRERAVALDLYRDSRSE